MPGLFDEVSILMLTLTGIGNMINKNINILLNNVRDKEL